MIKNLLKGTKKHKNYWKNRKDWVEKYSSPEAVNHPHRKVIVGFLKQLNWFSLIEIGCASGANLMTIIKSIPNHQLGGVDISEDAIKEASQHLKGALLKVNSADDIMMSDKSCDIILSDMTLIYVSPKDITRYLKEAKRVARNYLVLCEFHSSSWWNRLALRINTGYFAHDYKKLLTKLDCYDIILHKVEEKDWPGGQPQKTFAYIIICKIPLK